MNDPAVLNRIRWRCRRGMLELDAWLARFLDVTYPNLGEVEQALFEDLLRAEDDDLYGWLTGRATPPERYSALVETIKATKVSI
ncbi:MAG: succinate dehydrogenase assembly factor 2 [Hydrogenophilales bacterium]|nr:succinate dehydrogenase assembly factor 2 [Hydrogenophilales bacterium]